MACLPGYQLETSINTCVGLARGCEVQDANGVCTSCAPGWAFDNSETATCYQLPYGCDIVDQNSVCISCLTGYYIAQVGVCRWLPANCIRTDANGICTECRSDWNLDTNSKQCIITPSQPAS